MLTLDTNKVSQHVQAARQEAHTQSLVDWLRDQESNSKFLLDPNNPTNAPQRLGRQMTSESFERRLKKILPKVTFDNNTLGVRIARIELPNGVEFRVLLHAKNQPGAILPERSTMMRVQQDIPDESIVRHMGTSTPAPLRRADLPKHEWVADATSPLGGRFAFDDTVPAPGMKRIDLPWREVARGWRKVLIEFVVGGFLSPAQVEREFGADDTKEWAGQMGKRLKVTPW